MTEVDVTSARDWTLDDLAAVWRDAYAGYYVPLAFDAEQLRRHIRWTGLDLSLSVVGLKDGEPFGLSLAGRDGAQGWIGGFGVAPKFRLLGLGSALMRAHAARLDEAGIEGLRLEVITINPARKVYGAAGFRDGRDLDVWEGVLADGGEPGVELDAAVFAEAHARLHRRGPVWRRGLPRLSGVLAAEPDAFPLGVMRDGRIVGVAVVLNQPARFGLFDAAAEDEAAARSLLSAVSAVRPEAQARLVDEPIGTPMGAVLAEAGFTVSIRQVEMKR